jgi:nitrite reductase/ring-hydroxylating ferredoxin subunit
MEWYRVYDFRIHGPEPQKVYTVKTVYVNDQYLCMGRLPDGYFALSNICPHANAKLGDGFCDHEGKVICPLHRYKFDLKTGRGDQGDRVRPYPTEVREDGIYIGF